MNPSNNPVYLETYELFMAIDKQNLTKCSIGRVIIPVSKL